MIVLSFITIISLSRKGCIGNVSTELLWKEKFSFSAIKEITYLRALSAYMVHFFRLIIVICEGTFILSFAYE